MQRSLSLIAMLLVCAPAAAQDARSDAAMRAAVSPLPTDLRAGAGVFVKTPDGGFDRVKESENGMSCVLLPPADDTQPPRFDARCYSDLFWPAIFRRWELDPEHDTYQQVYARMHEEIDAGRVELPEAPTAGYRILGPLEDFDFDSGEPGPSLRKWQSIHFPFRTAETMGLTEAEEESQSDLPGRMPYVMASGTWWSHVMIVHQPFDR